MSESFRNKTENQLMPFPMCFLGRKSSRGDKYVVDSDLLT